MSDGFLMLAQAPAGLSCFWVPRWTPDGRRNIIAIQRLKDKLGDRSNASSEIELLDTLGVRVGDEGAGVRTIIEMVSHTRLDCTLGSAAIMRQCVAQATWHAHHRQAFGAVLDDQPLMANVLADLAIESEATTAAALRLARAFDAAPDDEHEMALKRLVTPIIKYWTCKRAPQHAAEALECLGGAGFVEESGLPRLYRQSPVNGVWEGSGNVICLDVLRALKRAPETLTAYWAEVDDAAGGDPRFDQALAELRTEMNDLGDAEARARRLVERLALVFQGSLLVRHTPSRGGGRVLRLAAGSRRRPHLRHPAVRRRHPAHRRSRPAGPRPDRGETARLQNATSSCGSHPTISVEPRRRLLPTVASSQ